MRKYPQFYSTLRKQGTALGRKERKDEGRDRVKEVRERERERERGREASKGKPKVAAGWRKGRTDCL